MCMCLCEIKCYLLGENRLKFLEIVGFVGFKENVYWFFEYIELFLKDSLNYIWLSIKLIY